ncbi:histidine phosphatase family protein [Niallia endozanthoxylica]|uniref:Histidine phosphatase family protein n=1 Tax=Niallia endozanthoxylica TaxID=2036016 RepID=A0A5J5H901_9BACI|nr:histidine phosphatase family protein [Niallia endozanthoxylica]KAA9017091.1 histidine phosphatase family protein [Niallia endozanthoxylica]
MLKLYIVRHGETEWNKVNRIQGRLDSHLSDKGREYARRLGEKIKDTEFAGIISSPSDRALETAKILRGSRTTPIGTDERIMEMHLGSWQGLTTKEIKEHYPAEYDSFMNEPNLFLGGDGESFADMLERANGFLEELKKSELTGNLLVVTHGLFIKILYLIFKEIELKDLWTEPTVDGTSLSIVKWENKRFELLVESDMSHVAE